MDTPIPCPVCGVSPESSASALLAVCDVLVIKALENLGMKIVRYRAASEPSQQVSSMCRCCGRSSRTQDVAGRERHRLLGNRPWYVAHTIFRSTDEDVRRALKGAWDVVPPLLLTYGGCCEVTSPEVTNMLDDYVHDLAITGTYHHITELAYRFHTRLGLPVYLRDFSALDPTEPTRTNTGVGNGHTG